MKLLITGGAGFIGTNLIHKLLPQNHQLLIFDKLTYAANKQLQVELADFPNVQWTIDDIANSTAVTESIQSFRPDAIIHLAAESHVDRSITSPSQFIQTNIVGTYNLLESSLHYYRTLSSTDRDQFRFLHVSTDEVYGSLGGTGHFTETSAYAPRSPYSATKASSNHLVKAWHTTYGLPVIITNSSNNYGPYQYPEKLVPVVILKALKNEPIPVYGNGENVRDWLYVEDHCDALIEVLHRGQIGETYNIGGKNELRNIDLVTKLCTILDDLRPSPTGRSYRDQITFVPDRPGHDHRYSLDTTKIETKLNWSPKHHLTTALHQTAQWYINHFKETKAFSG